MTDWGVFTKPALLPHDSKDCGGVLACFEKFRVGAILAIVTALNFFNGVNCSPKTESPTP